MTKDHVKSDKVSRNHMTFIEPAKLIADRVVRLSAVRRIVPGFITSSGLKPLVHYKANVKISKQSWGVLFIVRANRSVQEIRVYGDDPQEIVELVARTARDEGFHIFFDKREQKEAGDTPIDDLSDDVPNVPIGRSEGRRKR